MIRERETTALSEFEGTQLRNHFSNVFPAPSYHVYSTEIIDAVLETPSRVPRFHRTMLTALSTASDAGSRDQFFDARTISRVFGYDARHTSTGSFENGLLQELVTRVIRRAERPIPALQAVFEAMDAGLSRSALTEALGHFGDEPTHHGDSDRVAWVMDLAEEALRSERYDPSEIAAALEHARGHPLEHLVLERIGAVLAAEDPPAKLRELRAEAGGMPTGQHLALLAAFGASHEEVARSINGSRHTAYLDDMRLARKVVSVWSDVRPFVREPGLRTEAADRFVAASSAAVRSERALGIRELFELLQTNPTSQVSSLQEHWEAGDVDIRMLSGEEFDDLVATWRGGPEVKYCLFQQEDSPRPGRILIRELLPTSLASFEAQQLAFRELLTRLVALVHEGEHWRHSSGRHEGIEQRSEAISLDGISTKDRLVSEIMAYLEEYRWRARHLDDDYGELARRAGVTVPLHLRSIADAGYFHEGHARQIAKRLGAW